MKKTLGAAFVVSLAGTAAFMIALSFLPSNNVALDVSVSQPPSGSIADAAQEPDVPPLTQLKGEGIPPRHGNVRYKK